MTRLEDVWPLFGLQISTPRLTLNPVRDEQLPGLIDAVLAGIHDPAKPPPSTTSASPPKLSPGLGGPFRWWALMRLAHR